MLPWLLAAAAALTLTLIFYGWRERRGLARLVPLVVLRAAALTLLIALVLDAPAGRRRVPPPLVALDVSASWLRGGDSTRWREVREHARQLAGDSILLIGDSARTGPAPELPGDNASLVRALGERALGAGRAVVLLTDGEVDDPSALGALPSGSRVEVRAAAPSTDAAVISVEAPRAVVSGDTLEVHVLVRGGSRALPAGSLVLMLGGQVLASRILEPLGEWVERTERVRTAIVAPDGPATLVAVVSVAGDVERRNDTLAVAIDIARAAGAVFASTSPDFDARYAIAVLRGAVSLPTRGFLRVAEGSWRVEGTLAPTTESEVRRALRDAPVAIIHGDTALFGAPRSVTGGALALLAPPRSPEGEWYPVAAPPSPISGALSGISWDSLPPIEVGATPAQGDWEGLVTARARQFGRRSAVVGSERPRRVVVVGGAGFWRWQFRGGSSADAYAALWGSIFDWLSAERSDARAALPAEGVLRAGDPIRWRLSGARAAVVPRPARVAGASATSADSVVVARLRRRGATTGEDTLLLPFGGGVTLAETPPLASGIYDVKLPGGATILAINASRELLPRAPTMRSGRIGGSVPPGERPHLRDRGAAYLLILGALCAEWLLRRRIGLR